MRLACSSTRSTITIDHCWDTEVGRLSVRGNELYITRSTILEGAYQSSFDALLQRLLQRACLSAASLPLFNSSLTRFSRCALQLTSLSPFQPSPHQFSQRQHPSYVTFWALLPTLQLATTTSSRVTATVTVMEMARATVMATL